MIRIPILIKCGKVKLECETVEEAIQCLDLIVRPAQAERELELNTLLSKETKI